MATTSSYGVSRYAKRSRKRLLAMSAIALIVITWVLGAMRAESDLTPAIHQTMPDADHVVKLDDGLYIAWADKAEENLLGYIVLGQANGYGGPLTMAVAVNPSGEVVGTVIADHKETLAWMALVLKSDLLESLVGKLYTDPFEIDYDLDGVTGATYTSKAMAEAVLDGSQAAARYLGLPVKPQPPPKIIFGIPEIVLLTLFGVGYFGHRMNFKYKRQARWGSLLVGMIVLGFIYNSPLTLAYITKLSLGYWPQWQTNLYWYFLIGGIIFLFIVDNKNPYCHWFCPFGAAQECMGVVGGARLRRPRRPYNALKMLQRMLALGAILLGIYFRSPGLASYELYGTLFSLVGTSIQFVALGLVLIAAMFMRRPWCNYLCPVRPVLEIIRIFREWVKELWQKTNLGTKIS